MPKAWQTGPSRAGMGDDCERDRSHEQAVLEAELSLRAELMMLMLNECRCDC